MKKPHYPFRIKFAVVVMAVSFVVFALGMFFPEIPRSFTAYEIQLSAVIAAMYCSLAFILMSCLYILREKEALYVTVLTGCMILFFELVLGYAQGVVIDAQVSLKITILALHVLVLVKLSYMCFDAVIGGGNYKKEKKAKKHKKK